MFTAEVYLISQVILWINKGPSNSGYMSPQGKSIDKHILLHPLLITVAKKCTEPNKSH